MSTPEKPARRVPLGPALNWTPEEMDELSEITPADIAHAKADAPPAARRLLDAVETDAGDDDAP